MKRTLNSWYLKGMVSCTFVTFLVYALLGGAIAQAQTYTWASGVTASTWSTNTNWAPTAPTGGPGGAGQFTTDSANFDNLTTGTYTINYDSATSGYLSNLYLGYTSGTAKTTIDLNNSLTLTGSSSAIYSTSSANLVSVQLEGANTLTVAGTLVLGYNAGNSYQSANYIDTGAGYTGTGVSVLGTLEATASTTSADTISVAPAVSLSNGGTLQINNNGTTAGASGTRLAISGNFSTASGSTIESTDTSNSNASTIADNALDLLGSTINIASGTTLTNLVATGVYNGIVFEPIAANSNQSITLGVTTPFQVRSLNGGTSIATATTETDNVNVTATGHSVGVTYLTDSASYNTQVLQLGSNMSFATSALQPFVFSYSSGTNANINIDLNGYTYDMTSGSTSKFQPGSTSLANARYINIVNSGASSISGGNGVFKASGFNLGVADTGVGAGVILEATGTQFNSLANADTSAPTTIAPSSLFYYVGTATSDLYSSNRSVGGITVGTGSTASVLALGSTITAGGLVTVNSGATLNLTIPTGASLGTAGTYALTAAGLSGAGTVTNKSGTYGSAVTLTLNAGGASTNTFSGAITDTGTASTGLSVTLSSGKQILSGTNTYRGATTVNGGNLDVQGSILNTALTVNSGGALSGAGSAAVLTLNDGGLISPGDATTSLTAGTDLVLNATSLAWNSTKQSTLAFNLNAGNNTSTNLNLSSTLNLTGTNFYVDLTANGILTAGSIYDLSNFSNTNLITAELNSNASSLTYQSGYTGIFTNTGTQLDFDVVAVPEPSEWAMLIVGLGLLAFYSARKKVAGRNTIRINGV